MTPPENHRQIPPPGPSRLSSAFFETATACDTAGAFKRPTAYKATSSNESAPHYDATGSHERPTTHEPAATYERPTTHEIGKRKVAVVIGSRRIISPGASQVGPGILRLGRLTRFALCTRALSSSTVITSAVEKARIVSVALWLVPQTSRGVRGCVVRCWADCRGVQETCCTSSAVCE
jgi:hypothetical protein